MHPEVQLNLTQYDKTPHRAKAVTVHVKPGWKLFQHEGRFLSTAWHEITRSVMCGRSHELRQTQSGPFG